LRERQQVEAIFQAGLDLIPEERARYLSEVCAADASLKNDVQKLLAQHDRAGDLLEDPLGETELSALGSRET